MNKPAGTVFLYRTFPFRVDWKAELKNPSPGPLKRSELERKKYLRHCFCPTFWATPVLDTKQYLHI